MNEMTRSEFGRRFASLVVPVAVTEKGHIIGHWIPAEGGILGLGQRAEDERAAFRGSFQRRRGPSPKERDVLLQYAADEGTIKPITLGDRTPKRRRR